jgi:hypothetical protein
MATGRKKSSARRKPTQRLPQVAIRESEYAAARKDVSTIFDEVVKAGAVAAQGTKEWWSIFDQTIAVYLSVYGRTEWTGKLKRFVLVCVDFVALDLIRYKKRQGKPASAKIVRQKAKLRMRRFEKLSTVCNKQVERKNPQTGEVCGTYLDSVTVA